MQISNNLVISHRKQTFESGLCLNTDSQHASPLCRKHDKIEFSKRGEMGIGQHVCTEKSISKWPLRFKGPNWISWWNSISDLKCSDSENYILFVCFVLYLFHPVRACFCICVLFWCLSVHRRYVLLLSHWLGRPSVNFGTNIHFSLMIGMWCGQRSKIKVLCPI